MDDEDLFFESRLFPWLDTGCMEDETQEPYEPFVIGDVDEPGEWLTCLGCGEDFDVDCDVCPECGLASDLS